MDLISEMVIIRQLRDFGSEIKSQSKRFVFVNAGVRNTQRGREVKRVIYK